MQKIYGGTGQDLGMEENYRCCPIQTCPWEKEKKKEE
jgi:hypothetical protein